MFPESYHTHFPETEHIHFYAAYIGNFPDLKREEIEWLCGVINGV